MKRWSILLLKKIEWGSALACRLTQLTGKASIPTHPKHLIDFGQWYYLNSLKPTDKVLDLGCHAGEHVLKIAGQVRQLIGIDIDRQLISQAKSKTNYHHLTNVKFAVYDLEKKLHFEKSEFDVVFLFAVLEHLNHRDQMLSEIHRVLKPGGKLFLSVPNKSTNWKKLQRTVNLCSFSDTDHKIEFSKTEITHLLSDHNFIKIKIHPTAIDTPLSGLIDLIGGLSLKLYKQLMLWKTRLGRSQPHNCAGFLITATNDKK